jgi:hypothetical protein
MKRGFTSITAKLNTGAVDCDTNEENGNELVRIQVRAHARHSVAVEFAKAGGG